MELTPRGYPCWIAKILLEFSSEFRSPVMKVFLPKTSTEVLQSLSSLQKELDVFNAVECHVSATSFLNQTYLFAVSTGVKKSSYHRSH